MWIGPEQTRMCKLCQRFDIGQRFQYYEGSHVLVSGAPDRPRVKFYKGLIPPHNWIALLEMQVRLLWGIDKLAKKVPADNPASAPNAAWLDSLSVAEWGRQHLWTHDARRTLDVVVSSVFGCQASQLSMLQLLHIVRCAGGITQLVDVKDAAQDRRLVGGAQQISEHLAEAILDAGGFVETDACVVRVEASSPGPELHVTTRDGRVFRTRGIIVAVPPNVLIRNVDFVPRLPARVLEGAKRSFRGAYSKAIIIYPRPWWRVDGFSGFALNTDPSPEHVVSFVYDYCEDGSGGYDSEGRYTSPVCALVAFFTADLAVHASGLSAQQRHEAVLRSVARMFPGREEEAMSPEEYMDRSWNLDPYAQGAPFTLYGPGNFVPYGGSVARAPLSLDLGPAESEVPMVFWAGTEAATEWSGYMEGAVEAGVRAAAQVRKMVLHRLRPPTATSVEKARWNAGMLSLATTVGSGRMAGSSRRR